MKVTAIKDPTQLPWKELNVDIAMECTGIFTAKEKAAMHLQAGAKRVLVSAPGENADMTVVYGVNDDKITRDHTIVSNGSCTTNCLAPMAKIMNDAFGIESGFMTTIHSYTGDQPTLDTMHKDLYRARAAALNIIPTSTGAAKAIGEVLPELKGRLDGVAVRAPIPTGSVTDLTVQLAQAATVETVNDAFKAAAADGPLAGYLEYSEAPLVSADINQSQYSCIFDSGLTMANGNVAKVFGWYDNEWGYSCRLVDLVNIVGKSL
jgi:glyceraldehyde 3-phosphate dehydrogenase